MFASGRLPTMPRACMDVLRACMDVLRAFPFCVRSRMDVLLRCRVRGWSSCVRSHVHACCVRTWTSFHGAVCMRGRLAFVITYMRAACVRACVCGRLACVCGRIRAYVPSILHVSSFDFLSVPDRYINKVFIIITAINIHILIYIIKGNTIAMIVYLELLQPTLIYIVMVHSIAYVISTQQNIIT